MKQITKMNTKLKIFIHSKGFSDSDFRFGNIRVFRCTTLKEMREYGCEPDYPYVIDPIVTKSN